MIFSLVTELKFVLKKHVGLFCLVRLWLGFLWGIYLAMKPPSIHHSLFILSLSRDTHVTHTILELAKLKIHKFWNTLIDIYKIRKQIQTNDSNT